MIRPVCRTAFIPARLHSQIPRAQLCFRSSNDGCPLSSKGGCGGDLVRRAPRADAAMPARVWNLVVDAAAAVAVLARGAFLLIGVSAHSAAVVQAQHNGNELCGWMGVKVSPMTAPFAESLGMAEPYGAIFDRPEPGSPAADAHIEQGDVLTAINGAPLMRSGDFARSGRA